MSSVVTGFKYLFGIHMGVSRGPVDELVEIKVGDKSAWRGSVTQNSSINISAPNLFGGEEAEGGVEGQGIAMFGEPTQTAPSALASVLTSPVPGFRGRFTFFFDGVLTMMNPYPKPWKFRVRRSTRGWDGGCWYPEKATVTLVREASIGESGDTTETTQATATEQSTVTLVSTNLRATFNPPGTLVTVSEVAREEFVNGEVQLVRYSASSGAWSTSSSTQVPVSETVIALQNGQGNFELQLNSSVVIAGVTSVSYEVMLPGDGGFTTQTYDSNSGVWSVTGNVVTVLQGYGLTQAASVTVNYFYIAPGSNQSLPANTIQLNPAFGFTVPSTVWISYVYSITTVTPGGANLGTAVIKAMNPAHIVYECLTNREWGRGLPRTALDDDSFRLAADLLFNEGFGLCVRWNRRDEIRQFIKLILDHITANLYINRKTGKLSIKLVRADYKKSELPLFTTDTGLLSIDEADVSSAGTAPINEVRVTWRDPVTDEERTVRAVNLAARQAAGGVSNSQTYSFEGLPTEQLAQRVAKQRLNVVSRSLRRFNLTLDRRGYNLVPGGAFRIQDGPRGIRDMVVRIATINYGSLQDGRIKVQVVQDEFGLPSRGLTALPPKPWQPPNNAACVDVHRVIELPYRSIYRSLSRADFDYVDPNAAHLGVLMRQGNPLNATYDVAVRSGAVETEDWPSSDNYYCGYVPPTP